PRALADPEDRPVQPDRDAVDRHPLPRRLLPQPRTVAQRVDGRVEGRRLALRYYQRRRLRRLPAAPLRRHRHERPGAPPTDQGRLAPGREAPALPAAPAGPHHQGSLHPRGRPPPAPDAAGPGEPGAQPVPVIGKYAASTPRAARTSPSV